MTQYSISSILRFYRWKEFKKRCVSGRKKRKFLCQQVTELQKQIEDINLEIERLKREKAESVKEIVKEKKEFAEQVLGFTLAFTGGYWYATRKIGKANKTVYVGKDKSQAGVKIRAKYPKFIREGRTK